MPFRAYYAAQVLLIVEGLTMTSLVLNFYVFDLWCRGVSSVIISHLLIVFHLSEPNSQQFSNKLRNVCLGLLSLLLD